jgi:hypothetical protein
MGIETLPMLMSFAGSASKALLLGSVVGKVTDKLFGSKSDAPEVKPLTPMPDPLAQETARKQALIDQMSRRGRQATIMTDDNSGKLGG